MAKQVFIAVLLLVAFFAAPTHETTPSVEKEKATPRKLVGEFKDQTVVEKLIKLPRGVMVPIQDAYYPPDFVPCHCPPNCICVALHPEPPVPIICVCPYTPTRETIVSVKAAAAATPIEMAEKFQDRTVEKLIKLPQGVMVPNGDSCYPPYFDQCPPDCICVANLPYPPIPGICVCPSTKTRETIPSVKALAATPKKMVRKFQDQTVEKLIKLEGYLHIP